MAVSPGRHRCRRCSAATGVLGTGDGFGLKQFKPQLTVIASGASPWTADDGCSSRRASNARARRRKQPHSPLPTRLGPQLSRWVPTPRRAMWRKLASSGHVRLIINLPARRRWLGEADDQQHQGSPSSASPALPTAIRLASEPARRQLATGLALALATPCKCNPPSRKPPQRVLQQSVPKLQRSVPNSRPWWPIARL